MKEQRAKRNKWNVISVGIAVMGIGLWWNQASPLLGAEPDLPQSDVVPAKENVTRATGALNRVLTVVSNEQGLKATPKVVTIAQNGAFPTAGASTTELYKLISSLGLPAQSTGATFEYVDGNGASVVPSSATEGFQTVYIKITEKSGASSIQVPIPVNITTVNTTSLLTNQVMVRSDSRIILYQDETKDKTNQELQALIQSKANLSAWDMTNGEALPVSVTATTAVNNTVGSYWVSFATSLNGTTATTGRPVVIFGGTLKATSFLAPRNVPLNLGGTTASTFLTKYQTVLTSTAADATYQWVADKAGNPTVPENTFDTSKIGFKWGYIKMSDKATPTVSTVMAVPITVTSDNVTVVDSKIAYSTPRTLNMLKESEVISGTTQELAASLKESLGLVAWDVTNGAALPISITDLGGLTAASKVGRFILTFSTTLADSTVQTSKRTYTLLPDSIAEVMYDWQIIPYGSTEAVIVNPINNTKLEFKGRGPNKHLDANTKEQGFRMYSSSGVYYDYFAADYPYEDDRGVYATASGVTDLLPTVGIGLSDMTSQFVSQFYLKKGNDLKQILVDSVNQLVYVYDISLSKNLNFLVNLSMYNTDTAPRRLGLLKKSYASPANYSWVVTASGNNSGFSMTLNDASRTDPMFSIKLKDSKGQYLSEFTRQAPGTATATVAAYPDAPFGLANYNRFKADFSRLGIEQYNYSKGHKIFAGIGTGVAYQLGAPARLIANNEALKTGYEIFAGTELPYMRLTSEPEEWHVYPDYQGGDFVTDYTLASIPSIDGHGTIFVEYPNQVKTTIPFVADSNLEFNGKLTVPRATLPTILNDESGTIKKYATSMLGIHETEGAMKDLPSNDYAVTVNVYNIGGAPIAQTVKKDATWSKAASDLIKNPVILPGHTANFEYVGAQPDTSKLGLQFIKVRMTDRDEPTQTTVIEVPVNVIDGTPPVLGITVAANDFSITKGKVAGLSSAALKALILKESKAVAWENATGLSAGVDLVVTTTNVPADPSINGNYSATIQGTKEGQTGSKTVAITVGADIEAKSVTQRIPLGTASSYWNASTLKNVVKEVKEGATTVSDYTVTLVTPPITDRITTGSLMTVKVASVANPSQGVDVEIPVTVTWGNSLAMGGSGTTVTGAGQSTLALTLHEDASGRPYLSSAYGNLPKGLENTALASVPGESFYQVTHLDMSAQAAGQEKAKEVTDGPNATSEVSLQAMGHQTPAQMVTQLGTAGKLSVNYGDILKVYAKQGQQALYTDDTGPTQPLAGLPNVDTLFVRVSKEGFTPLYFNQLSGKEVEIASESTATTALYGAHYNSTATYFNVPTGATASAYVRIKPNGFASYPKLNLAVGEKDGGRVLVAEPTSATSNQYLAYAYDVTFVGTGAELQIVSPLAPLSFGSQTIKSQSQEIKRSDPNWSFTVLDSRQTKAAWVIQAKMPAPFKTSGANPKVLTGAELRLKQASGTVSLNSSFQTIYTKETPAASNNVTWATDKGFFLQVPPGVIEKEASYSTEVEFLLTNAP